MSYNDASSSSSTGIIVNSASSCSSSSSSSSSYSQSLSIGAVFIILIASLLGNALPIFFQRHPHYLRYPFLITVGKHCGTGVLLALAFIHLLPPAFDELGAPCLPTEFLTYQYAPLFAMIAALVLHLIELVVSEYTANATQRTALLPPSYAASAPDSPASHSAHDCSSSYSSSSSADGRFPQIKKPSPLRIDCKASPSPSSLGDNSPQNSQRSLTVTAAHANASSSHFDGEKGSCVELCEMEENDVVVKGSQSKRRPPSKDVELDSLEKGVASPSSTDSFKSSNASSPPSLSSSSSLSSFDEHAGHSHGGLLLGANADRTIAAYILEFGLTSHSVIIGITLGISSASDQKTLIPALVFHQFFEGFALGARLASVGFSSWNELLLIAIYSFSCPLGIAIGIGIVSSYNPDSPTANLTQGVFDSVAAGILFYIAFVQMIAVDFAADFKACGNNYLKKISLLSAIYVGVTVMAIIGRWL